MSVESREHEIDEPFWHIEDRPSGAVGTVTNSWRRDMRHRDIDNLRELFYEQNSAFPECLGYR